MANQNYCAYVAIKTDPKTTKEVFRKIADTRGVKQAHLVTGRYDMLILVEGEQQKNIFNTVLSEIRF